MPITAGTRLGPYEVVAPLGAGGMGEVFKARDTRLDRNVAIKVLPAELAQNAQFKIRFEREAKTISQLNHPHICALYDVGENYLVMELLEGETLAEKLAKGPLPLDQVIRYGIEIAEALEKAHRAGVVHRDLKPGNVMITKSGAKLLDFGLAKEAESSVAALTSLRTEKKNLTEEGTIIGTFQYMAPEQLEGGEVDARTDIFALGALLYEMTTGRRAFAGNSKASLIASILTAEPQPISTAQPMTPPALDRVVRTCLQKDPDDRFSTAHDVLLELRWIATAGDATRATTRERKRQRLAWFVSAIAVLVAVATAVLFVTQRAEPRLIRSSIDAPEKSRFSFDDGVVALSPDGRRLAFVARNSEGRAQLWIRSLDQNAAQPLGGTEGAQYPFWSPDSRYLGFFANGKLQRIDSAGGAAESICDAIQGRGGDWNRDGVIIFSPSIGDAIYRVSSSGGTPVAVTRIDASRGEYSHRWPSLLPDGQHFLYLAQGSLGSSSNNVYIGSLDGSAPKLLFAASSNAVCAPNGYLLFVREGALRAQPFDAKRLRVTGEAVPIAQQVQYSPAFAIANFSVSNDGTLAYIAGASATNAQLVWFDRTGKKLEAIGGPSDCWDPRLSHDGRRIALTINDVQGGDIWTYDIARRVFTRLTFDPANEFNPMWSPDDRSIAFTSYRNSPGNIWRKSSTGDAEAQLFINSAFRKIISDWSADGSRVLFSELQPKTLWDVTVFEVGAKTRSAVVASPFADSQGVLSPDSRWMAYVSNESGRNEVYVRQFPVGGKWQLSTGGGTMPLWARSGKELFYVANDGKVTSVPVTTNGTFTAGDPKPLFAAPMRMFSGLTRRQYDVSADGQRFLINVNIEEQTALPVSLVQNWTKAIRK